MSFNYSPRIITDGLVLYLDAANTKSYISGSTTWSDLSRSGNNGTLTNGPIYKTNNYGVIELDGSNDFIPLSGFTYNRSSFSVESFFRFVGGSTNYRGGILSKWLTGGGNSNEFLLYSSMGSGGIITPGNPQFLIQLSDNTFSNASDTTITMVTNTWYHQVGTFDGQYVRVYLNGVLRATTDLGTVKVVKEVPSTDLNVGGFANISYPSSIQMAIARIYNKPLSASEILQNYNATKTRFGL